MLNNILKRLGIFCLVLTISTSLVFFMLHSLPGENAEVMAKYIFLGNVELNPSNEEVQLVKEKFDLDRSLLSQYYSWATNALHGDLGRSYKTNAPVREEILIRLPATITLALIAVLMSLLIGMPLGILAAVKQNSTTDYLCSATAVLGISMPNFWLALLLIMVFSLALKLTPTIGYGGPSHLILPVVTLGTATTAVVMRLTRSSTLEVMRQDYIRTARGKGLDHRDIMITHSLKNALIPIITMVGLEFGHLLGGAVIIETIFAWPGIGRLLIDSISARDIPVIQGTVLFITLMYMLLNFTIDILYPIFDPRIGGS
ncbi:MAG: ABC transporter permease [Methanothrix soehngenii]|jgi:peptide/nickel transport system permease protein|uniref:ABC transporter permease n=1 Tax=Methanothrix soehngenii TaxID=2223 RepID=UPI0023F08B98|nr:ABC transporter permease [Methanothrix soehngenii]MCK9585736.1 ABC transporter permease [Methanothrix soehngenii]MDD3552261.1 ABC transporter permease [Methanothrix soehngenii]MDD3973658.1 ABC transporter permease [Methanothrix soehngenii]MDD4488066.1 ABC transporter permease [Methanothrix soehngenii]MDD5256722.1 ABC transporter permease [Methanothrix soehngenii]